MKLFEFLLSLVLLAVAVVSIVVIVRWLFGPLAQIGLASRGGREGGSGWGRSGGSGEGAEPQSAATRGSMIRVQRKSFKLRRAGGKLSKIDKLLDDQKPEEALKLLRKAIVLDVALSEELIDALKEHHQHVLSRCLVIADDIGSKPENIADVERLFLERTELQTLLSRAVDSFKNLRSRREKAGKGVPDWSKTDYEQRIQEIRQELSRNEENLNEQLEKLFEFIRSPGDSSIVYH